MHRVDGPGAAPGGLFRSGDPSTGLPATTVTADILNALQEEDCHLIEFAGLTLNKADNTQLRKAVQALIAATSVPVGTVIEGYWLAAPTGYVLIKGDLVNRTGVYAGLWAHAQANGLVVSDAEWLAGQKGFFSSGNGSTTFRLPDIRAEFTRAWDNGRGTDAGRALGSTQSGMNEAHTHEVTDPGHAHASQYDNRTPTGIDGVNAGSEIGGSGDVWTFPTTQSVTGLSVNSAGGSESRPRNVALNKAIKY